MGAAKFPEQILERREAGLRSISEEEQTDPIILRLRATPVSRKISRKNEELTSTINNVSTSQTHIQKLQNRLQVVKRDIKYLSAKNFKSKWNVINQLKDQASKLSEMLAKTDAQKRRIQKIRLKRQERQALKRKR